MHHARHDDAVDVAQDLGERFTIFGRISRQLRADRSGSCRR
jgi:hypothetical protein